jgi:hypothetical protein
MASFRVPELFGLLCYIAATYIEIKSLASLGFILGVNSNGLLSLENDLLIPNIFPLMDLLD